MNVLRAAAAAVGVLVTLSVASARAQVPAPDFVTWFARPGDATGTPIDSLGVGAPGSTFAVSVWYRSPTAFPHNAVNVFLGFDRTTSTGAGALPLDGILALAGGPADSITGVGADFTLGTPVLGGGQSASAGDRPFGIDVPLEGPLGSLLTGEDPAWLFDIQLVNNGLLPGAAYSLTLWDGQIGEDFTSFLVGDTELARPGSSIQMNLFVASAPEPGSAALLGTGVAALVVVGRRRRTEKG